MKRLLLIGALLLTGCGGSKSPSDTFHFTYHPPDSLSFNAEVLSLTYRIRGTDTTVDSSFSQTSHLVYSDSGGYRINSKTDSMWFSQGGQRVESPIVELFSSGQFTHVIDSTGHALDVRGYDELFSQLDTLLSPDTAAMVRQNVNPAQLREREIRDWNQRMGKFAGQYLRLKEPEYDSIDIALPSGGALRGYQITELIDTMRIGDALCGDIRVTAHTDPRELAAMSGQTVAAVVAAYGITDSILQVIDNTPIQSSAQSDWVVEVNTMLAHSFDQTRELKLQSAGPDGAPTEAKLVDRQVKKYMYP